MIDVERRITSLESDIKILYGKVNKSEVSQAEANTKLDNMLVTLGELKESMRQLKERPNRMWDKLIFAIIGAVGTAIGVAIAGNYLK